MEKKEKFGFLSQDYEAPRAEEVTIAQESTILTASILNDVTTSDYDEETVDWGGGL